MEVRVEIEEKVRRNKIEENQIHHYLEKINSDNEEQRMYIGKIRKNLDLINMKGEEDDA